MPDPTRTTKALLNLAETLVAQAHQLRAVTGPHSHPQAAHVAAHALAQSAQQALSLSAYLEGASSQ